MHILKNKKNSLLILSLLFIVTIMGISFHDPITRQFYSLVKNIEQRRMINYVREYYKLESDRYIIRYNRNEDIDIAKQTEQIMNKYYDEICTKFNYYPKDKINIVIYSDGDTLLENVRLRKNNPPLGVYYSGVISILSPKLWINTKDDFNKIYEKKGPVVHEFVHLIVDEKTQGNYPMWLTEGIALYTEYKTTGFEWGKNLKRHEDITIEELNNDFHNISPYLSYRKSFEIVKKISETWGFDKLILLLDTLGEGNSISKSTKIVLKINLKDIE